MYTILYLIRLLSNTKIKKVIVEDVARVFEQREY